MIGKPLGTDTFVLDVPLPIPSIDVPGFSKFLVDSIIVQTSDDEEEPNISDLIETSHMISGGGEKEVPSHRVPGYVVELALVCPPRDVNGKRVWSPLFRSDNTVRAWLTSMRYF